MSTLINTSHRQESSNSGTQRAAQSKILVHAFTTLDGLQTIIFNYNSRYNTTFLVSGLPSEKATMSTGCLLYDDTAIIKRRIYQRETYQKVKLITNLLARRIDTLLIRAVNRCLRICLKARHIYQASSYLQIKANLILTTSISGCKQRLVLKSTISNKHVPE